MSKKIQKYNGSLIFSNCVSFVENNGRHSYKIFKNLSFYNLELKRLWLNNCYVSNCNFNLCNFDNGDLLGTEYYNCSFVNTSFNNTDISSCRFINCSFINCSFDSADITDCNFNKCILNKANFDDASVSSVIWEKCYFESFAPNSTSMYTNDFIRCNFINSKLLTAIYYTIFDHCTFKFSEIDSYILGFQFGIRQSNFNNLSIEHFNEKSTNPYKALTLMNDVYAERKMIIEQEILRFISSKDFGQSLDMLVDILFSALNSEYIINVDEIRFIRRIINHLFKKYKLPTFYFIFIIDKLGRQPVAQFRAHLSENIFNEITILYHTLFSIKNEIEDSFNNLSAELLKNYELTEDLLIEFKYKTRPELRIYDIIDDFNADCCLKPVSEAYGSFYEIYQIISPYINEISAIITVLGAGVSVVSKIIQKLKKKRSNKANITKNKTKVKTVIREEIITTSEAKCIQSEQSIYVHEAIYRKSVTTVISKKTEIIKSYGNNNLRNIDLK